MPKVIIHRPDMVNPPHRRIGLGDAVKTILSPIVKASDSVLGTKLAGCAGCAKRQETLNAIVPDIVNPFQNLRDKGGDVP